ncbi:replication initiation factor domain-containing protein [Chitiniphilus purpureus]|uniref:Replication initiation factor domain-containing protein n=1 Tax=Chitiniphilus purpureus TaxID=2981137 RepID=A0ABY6DK76_9NEIS|nr:replication initiation factor domain-containing protein [Chitiniphilus sp. CD1]UXY14093.1 replication initiation factor domain-containing protein [Chitiniphilus sp. CD1]
MPRKNRPLEPLVSRDQENRVRHETMARLSARPAPATCLMPPRPQFEHVHGSAVGPQLVAEVTAARAVRAARERDSAASGGGLPPHTNRGEKAQADAGVAAVVQHELEHIELVISDSGDVLLVPRRFGYGDDAAFIDWLHITIHKDTALRYSPVPFVTEEDLVMALSLRLETILGYGVTDAKPNGHNYYKRTFTLGDNWGTVSIGGQQDTIMVAVFGSGLAAAAPGWEARMHQFLADEAIRPRITRVDLSFDDIQGQFYSVDQAHADWVAGHFTNGGRRPAGERRGDWDFPNGAGRTMNIGKRDSGRMCRVYEKGMQLGHKWHPWTRVEVELKSEGYLIPFDVLLRAGAYLAASYPALHWIAEQKADRLESVKNTAVINLNKAIEIVRQQFGHYLWMIQELCGGDAQTALDLVSRQDKIPPRFKVPDYQFSPQPMHDDQKRWLTDVELKKLYAGELDFAWKKAPAHSGAMRIGGLTAPLH